MPLTRLDTRPRLAVLARPGAALAVALAALFCVLRIGHLPLMPIDETRYLSVAWEMWQHQSFLVPLLNGEPYPHKPPLLFWVIQSAWALFGTSDWVSRLAVPAVGLLAYPLLATILRQFDPDAHQEARWAPLVLMSLTLWFVYQALSMFDVLFTTCFLVAVLGWVRYVRSGRTTMLLLAGVGVGLSVLAKGPVVLLYWLPLALGTRFWRPAGAAPARRYWAGVLAATLVGAGIALAWAIPAALAGGSDYAEAIFWGQSAGRVTNAFEHARPWYWYLPLLPLLTLPWSGMAVWRRPWLATPMQRFAAWGSLPPLLLLSLVSGKQIHYLMPILPFLATWIASRLAAGRPHRARVVSLVLALVTLLLAALPEIAGHFYPQAPLPGAARLAALVPAAFAVLLWRRAHRLTLTLAWPLSLLTLLLAVSPAIRGYYDIQPAARQLARLEARHVPVAYLGNYADQFRFLGRTQETMTVFGSDAAFAAWRAAHPQGVMIEVLKRPDADLLAAAVYQQPYRGSHLLLIPVAAWPLLADAH
ncbi:MULTISPECIES: glycosyltransferase family 39 protein [unclassified Modicisalibacter]|uniref:ArnT family glycosyltransferase n=1 Tax=unclassified Modicisalibacter TaxID=2679913 RepID=UPI001CC98006|nr:MULTISPECIES: glycosyltransferase family 39 protein [unclassified Modicisalibacter]MBZ9557857.1 glycosyltransferase family 39 protein [Modicisalibacter sp. R2A 31.J]MBZ9573477.1 glycosyltransferase family 39 protein [Modicisalibacter sp. MOD 31.J]